MRTDAGQGGREGGGQGHNTERCMEARPKNAPAALAAYSYMRAGVRCAETIVSS